MREGEREGGRERGREVGREGGRERGREVKAKQFLLTTGKEFIIDWGKSVLKHIHSCPQSRKSNA